VARRRASLGRVERVVADLEPGTPSHDHVQLLVVAVLVLRVLRDELVARLLRGPRADPESLDPDRISHTAELRPAVADLLELVEVGDPVLGRARR
jgi:hypothetical protein